MSNEERKKHLLNSMDVVAYHLATLHFISDEKDRERLREQFNDSMLKIQQELSTLS